MRAKGSVWGLGLFTLIGFPFLGMVILRVFPSRFFPNIFYLFSSSDFWLGAPLGLAVGTVIGLFAFWLTQQPIIAPSAARYTDLLSSLNLNYTKIVFLSFCAGFGEEVLFRGVLQYYWGVWPTAIVFVAIHGYLNPKDWRISVYGGFMTLAMALLGYMHEWLGIYSAISAHFAIDLVLLILYKKYENEGTSTDDDFIIDETSEQDEQGDANATQSPT